MNETQDLPEMTEMNRALIYLVAPFGTAMLSFYEIVNGGPAWFTAALLALGMLMFAVASRTFWTMLDERLNPDSQDAADLEEWR